MDKLPFSTPEKAQRYQTENYRGAMGLNWYLTDPTLQFIIGRITYDPMNWRSQNPI